MKSILNLLRDPRVAGMDVDGLNRLAIHTEMLQSKKMLKQTFVEFHHLFRKLDKEYLSGVGNEIEIGAGVSPMKNSYPEVMATDIVSAPNLDKVINAQDMDLPNASVRTIYGQNCFHHFPNPNQFFNELERVLIPGGGAILLEPYHGPVASFLYKRLFSTEGFDKTFPSWETPVIGPMNGANQALSYIVFIRDHPQFKIKYPNLTVTHQRPVGNYLKYLLSGGLNFRQLLPDSFTGSVSFLEKLISPLNQWLALHHVIVIRKNEL